ncbi:MAG: PQQ-binding-like beta-propeller repeat protein [Planctomycetota bacterium]|nr:PQQ-binding-like beta-propeller repeat protein [Planctomycetota bacterium]
MLLKTESWRATWIVFLAFSGGGTSVFGQVFPAPQRSELSPDVQLEEADHVARSHLERIDRFLQDRQWDESVEALRRLLENDSGKLMRIDQAPASRNDTDSFVRYVPLRTYCQIKLAGLHASAPEALKLYRTRVDPLVERWYQEGVSPGNEAQLRRIVDRFLVSRFGDQALFRLGELALERGDFNHARAAWERINPRTRISGLKISSAGVPADQPVGLALDGRDLAALWDELGPLWNDAKPSSNWLVYPDSDLEFAAVLARLTLVSVLEGSPSRAKAELQLLRRLAPDAEGVIGGRRGKFTELLGSLLQQSNSWSAAAVPPDWRTLGGSATRTKVASTGVDIALQPLWRVALPSLNTDDRLLGGIARPAEARDTLLSYHPIVVRSSVLLNTGESLEDVHAFDLHSGQRLWPGEVAPAANDVAPPAVPGLVLPEPVGQFGVPRYTMTAWQNRLFVKLGPQATAFPLDDRPRPWQPGYLAAVDLDAQKKRLFEIHFEDEPWGLGWTCDGPPITDDANLYVALRRRDNLRAQAHVACFDMKRGKLRWRRSVAAAETPGQGRLVEYTHSLLTLSEGTLFFNTNLGAVAALRAEDGEIEWILTYPRAPWDDGDPDRSRRHWYRDLNPCLVHKGLIIVAPTDCDRLFALDAATGLVVWSTPPQQAVDVVHLLGVGSERLIASGDRIYWIDIRDGQIATSFPARVEDGLRGYGRGLLAGSSVYWPTRDKIYVFAQDGSRQVRQPIDLAPLGLTGGNLVLAEDVLLIATANELVALSPFGRQVTQAAPAR